MLKIENVNVFLMANLCGHEFIWTNASMFVEIYVQCTKGAMSMDENEFKFGFLFIFSQYFLGGGRSLVSFGMQRAGQQSQKHVKCKTNELNNFFLETMNGKGEWIRLVPIEICRKMESIRNESAVELTCVK